MNVVLVTSLARGGPVEHALLLGRDLVRAGHAVSAIAADDALAGRFAALGIGVATLRLRPGLDLAGARRLHRAVQGAEVVHSHDRRSGLWVRAAPRARRETVLVHSLHGLPEPYLPPPAGAVNPGVRAIVAYRGVERGLAARSDALVAPSRAATELLERRLGYPHGAIEVVPNGVDVPQRPPVAGGELVGTLSVMEPVKGLDVFLRAAARIAAVCPAARFALFGSGSLEGELRVLANRLGLAERVVFPGFVPADEALARLRVLVLPSWYEAGSLTLLQAMASGVPSVASRVGGTTELVSDDAVALVKPGDPTAITEAVLRLLADPQLAARRARTARAVAAERSSARTAAAMASVYERALARRAGRR